MSIHFVLWKWKQVDKELDKVELDKELDKNNITQIPWGQLYTNTQIEFSKYKGGR